MDPHRASGHSTPPGDGPSGAGPSATTRRRPRDRKQQILGAARDLFVAQGYLNVTMADIAERVGITAGALYRHYDTKAVLLERVFDDSFDWLEAPVSARDYAGAIDQVVDLVVGTPYLADLWTHEMRHLSADARRALRRRMRAWNQSLVPGLRAERGDLDDGQTELLLWAVQSMIASVGRQALQAPLAERVPAIRSALLALTTAPLVPMSGPAIVSARTLMPASMRQRLLIAAFEQFTLYGFHGTSMTRIGAAVDVTGASIYGYFDSKEAVLRAVLDRGAHALWLALDEALRTASDAEDALHRLIRSYVDLARHWASNAEDPRPDRPLAEAAAAFRREYLAEWLALVMQTRPHLDKRTAYLRVRLGLFLVADLYSNPRLTATQGFPDNLAALLASVLLDGPRHPTSQP